MSIDNKNSDKIQGSKGNNDFVTSYFAWVELDEQKNIAEKLENITTKNNKK